MPTGKMRMINHTRGFGFITQDDGGPDLFCHVSRSNSRDFDDLVEGDLVTYDVTESRRGGPDASNVRRIETAAMSKDQQQELAWLQAQAQQKAAA